MQATFLAIRAVGAELARRLWLPVVVIALVVAVALGVLLGWLVSLDAWWWLLAIPLSIGVSVAAIVLVVTWLLIRYVRPEVSRAQRTQIRAFVDQLQAVQEIAGTPKFLILLRVVRSISAPRSDSYLEKIVSSRQLGRDFREIVRGFGS